MPPSSRKRSALLEFALIFAIVYLGTQFVFRTFFPQSGNGPNGTAGIILKPVAARVTEGNNMALTVRNATTSTLVLPARCPMPPVEVSSVQGDGSGSVLTPLTATGTALPCVPITEIAPGASTQIDLSPWKYSLFGTLGTFEVRLPQGAKLVSASGAVVAPSGTLSARVTLTPAGSFTKLFRAFITKPFLNFLIFIASILPGHSLGVSIIILTLVVKFLLFIPTQHSLKGQKKMQKAQPLLDEIRRRHKEDPKRMQEETMKVWKEHGINPFQSCLPLLIQMPVLIGVFYVVRDGSLLALSRHLIYPFYQHLTWTFGTTFLGLDLLKPNVYLFPPLLVILQFLQMKLSFAMAKKKREQSGSDKPQNEAEKSQQLQQKMMLYGLPLMIGVFAFRFPAAVSLYWGISTVFAIGQQVVVNRKG